MLFRSIIVSEAVKTESGESVEAETNRYGGIGNYLAAKIGSVCGAETRVTLLGIVLDHRNSSPLAFLPSK